MKKVLVTGGAGYIGSHACKALSSAGIEPICYDNLSRGFANAVKWGPLEIGDIVDKDKLNTVFRYYRPDAVMHFAALAYVGESVAQPGMYWRNNVEGSLSLLDVTRANEVDQFVFSSSCTVYGDVSNRPIAESTAKQPSNPYGTTKLIVENMLKDYASAYQLNSIALRYFNVAGADPDGEIGEDHDPEPHLIPLVFAALGEHPRPLTIFGNDYPTDDGTCIRDYIHVTDLAAAHVRSLQYLLDIKEKGYCHQFNLGIGKGYSVKQVIKVIESVTGLTATVQYGDRRIGDPASLISDATLGREVLQWQPQYPELTSMIESAWRWYQRVTNNNS